MADTLAHKLPSLVGGASSDIVRSLAIQALKFLECMQWPYVEDRYAGWVSFSRMPKITKKDN